MLIKILKGKGSKVELSERKLKILASIIDVYVATGDPVGSKLIAEKIGVSSATIRNEMADLIEMGFLLQPHTSAGRIPSERGFREYINSYLNFEKIATDRMKYLESVICSGSYNKTELLKITADILSKETNFLAAITEPDDTKAIIRAVQFVQISRRTAMLILITSGGAVQNKIFRCDYDLSSDIMRIFFRIFNEHVTGKRLNEISLAFIQSLAIKLYDMVTLLTPALLAFYEAVRETQKLTTVIKGELSLLDYEEFSPLDIKKINETLLTEGKLSLLENSKNSKVSIILGNESKMQEFKDAAIVSAAYEVGGKKAGSISLVGPLRMNYSSTASLVSYCAKLLGDSLSLLKAEI